jgi:hypothetical protein
MQHVRIWLKSGAVVEFDVKSIAITADGEHVTNMSCVSSDDPDLPRLGWIDVTEIAAAVVTGVRELPDPSELSASDPSA